MQILIVDDDDIALELLRNSLTRAGYEVEIAHNGHEALDVLHNSSCRLVVSDWEMPGMDGIELCKQIRSDAFRAYIYVILLTARDGINSVVDGLSAGADDFITKPFAPAELCVRVRAGERILALETRDVTIFAMAKLVESRDPESGAHLERIRGYAQTIAKHLADQEKFRDQIDANYARQIYLTSPLHDIGKVGIPDCVLLKPGRLSDREFEIMKTHTTIGGETLDAALQHYPGVEFLRMARDVAVTHHERFDGSGYPSGLAGYNIPLCGRIVALADVYDALMSKRVYKEPFSHDIARSIIVEEKGKHFDPDIIEAFLQNEDVFIATHNAFSKSEMVEAAC